MRELAERDAAATALADFADRSRKRTEGRERRVATPGLPAA
jgi:hypothetical protein